MRHIIPISGKDSLCVALLLKDSPLFECAELMFNPTGQEPPEVFDWMRKVEVFFGKKVVMVGEDLEGIIEENNWFLPSANSRYCTRESKIKPMERFIGNDECLVYYGIRADEPNRIGYNSRTKLNISPVYPLRDAGIGIEDVYRMVDGTGIKPPSFFWERLYDKVCQDMDGIDIGSLLKAWEIDYLFAWRSRTNCSMCYNQRMYEWVGLIEHHPDLFEKYQGWETNVSTFYFNGKDRPLSLIKEKRESIFLKRAEAVKRIIFMKAQGVLFDEHGNSDDILSYTSCGLFCGK